MQKPSLQTTQCYNTPPAFTLGLQIQDHIHLSAPPQAVLLYQMQSLFELGRGVRLAFADNGQKWGPVVTPYTDKGIISRANAAHQLSKWGLEKKYSSCLPVPPPTRLSLMDATLVERERREHHVFGQLLDSYPGLLERLKDGSEEEILHVGELIGKGAAGARGDDTKTLKSAVLNWISPKGEAIQPPLHRNSKIDRGFNHELTGSLLCPAGLDWNDSRTKEDLRSGEMLVCGDQWPIFLYALHTYDPEDPWCGLLRSRLLVCAYKHVFTSPSSVERESKATSIEHHTSIAAWFSCTTKVFSRTDTTTDSETFYHSLLDLLEDPEECQEVDELLIWWNRLILLSQVFPTSSAVKRPISANSALSKIRQKRLALRQAADSDNGSL
ncbi:uncharacterized protein HD556DRAFT_1306024 [Suillus plorans]|uniref:Uncharacterized protein n=1 Tax=Suillus plorans TaxID=116603 RepID=A0A9P7J048_9AGAM|nr:uncharacterized protein HD556DRAFT_1306024 [Suillus plorans]KAG1798572.1 hypothetical protein HD556DRAFT_1306024 [Suillus plorans]